LIQSYQQHRTSTQSSQYYPAQATRGLSQDQTSNYSYNPWAPWYQEQELLQNYQSVVNPPKPHQPLLSKSDLLNGFAVVFDIASIPVELIPDYGDELSNGVEEEATLLRNLAQGIAKGTGEIVNGNSKLSTAVNHGYEISATETGDVVKTGISGRPLNKNGTSPRAISQVNRWNREDGYNKYEAQVVETGIPDRQVALEWEEANAQRLWDEGNSMSKHQRPRPW
jgi:URI fold toxin 2